MHKQQMISEGYLGMEMRVKKIEGKVAMIEKNMATKGDLKKLETTLIPLRDKASKWDLISSLWKTWHGRMFSIIIMLSIALAGQRLFEIVCKIIPKLSV